MMTSQSERLEEEEEEEERIKRTTPSSSSSFYRSLHSSYPHHQVDLDEKSTLIEEEGSSRIERDRLRYIRFDRSSTNTEEHIKLWELSKIVRRNVFIEETTKGRREEDEEFDVHDQFSRHVMSFLGDMPVSYGRWRVVDDEGSSYALIDRWCTLERHRKHGYAKRLLVEIVDDIRRQKCSLSAVVVICPETARNGAPRVVERLGFRRIGQPFERDDAIFFRAIVARPFRLSDRVTGAM